MLHMLAYYVMPTFSKERVNAFAPLCLDTALPLNLHYLDAGEPATFDGIQQSVIDHIQMAQ